MKKTSTSSSSRRSNEDSYAAYSRQAAKIDARRKRNAHILSSYVKFLNEGGIPNLSQFAKTFDLTRERMRQIFNKMINDKWITAEKYGKTHRGFQLTEDGKRAIKGEI